MILSVLSVATSAQTAIAIIVPGSFHGDEVPADTTGRWFAVVPEPDGRATLRSVDVAVVAEHDVIVDNEGEVTGKRVETSPRVEAIVLVRGLPRLRDRPLPTALIQQAVEPNRGVVLRFGQGSYDLSVRCEDASAVDGQQQQKCELILEADSVKQSLFSYSAYLAGNDRYWASEVPPTVVWAGDLDADGRLDLLLNTSDHYNVSELRLYLSSMAKAGELASEVASFRSVGC